jgi:transcriptional regulator
MYVPAAFAQTDLGALHDLIEAHDFGLLVSQGPDGLIASHLPFLLDRTRGAHGTLYAHVARANPQWRNLADGEAMAVFQGPHAYISPSWYKSHPSVPTWNYAAAHVYGRVTLIEDAASLQALVNRLVARHEGQRAPAWSTEGLPQKFIDGMLRGIVGFEMAITRIDGKQKLSQNRSATDRRGVIAALAGSESTDDRALGAYMQAHAAPGEAI